MTFATPAGNHAPKPNWKLTLMQNFESSPVSKTHMQDGVQQAKEDVLCPASPTSTLQIEQAITTLDESLFENAAQLKIKLAEIAMHLSPRWRQSIFKNIDRLLSVENWEEEESSEIELKSFATFLRFVVQAGPIKLPSLGVGKSGSIWAGWQNDSKRVMVEFFQDDQANLVMVIPTDRGKEALSWRGHVASIREFLQRNAALDCMV